MSVTQAQQVKAESLSDEDLVGLARGRDEAAVRAITRRYNVACSALRAAFCAMTRSRGCRAGNLRARLPASTCFGATLLSAPGSRASP